MNKIIKACLLVFLITGFIGCDLDTETLFSVRSGGQRAGSGFYETGVYVSPAGSLVPNLIQDGTQTMTLTEIETHLRQLNFNQNWIQSVKNNLNNSNSAFIFYVNVGDYYRYLWITKI